MNNKKNLILSLAASFQIQNLRAQVVTSVIEENKNAVDCSEFQIGTTDELNDVVLDGNITPEFSVPKLEFPHRDPHTFFIRGPIHLTENPIVYSMRENGSQLIAFTAVENSRNLVKVDVKYEDSCETDFELMKMDIHTEQCGLV